MNAADIFGNLLAAMAVLLLSAIVVPFFAQKRKLAGWLNFILVAVAGIIILNISYVSIFKGGSLIDLGPLCFRGLFNDHGLVIGGFHLYFLVDSFAGFFMAIIAFMAMMSAFYSIQYMEHYPEYSLKPYYVNFPIFILGMVALVTLDDLSIGFTIAWQLMTIASYFLVKFEFKKAENVKSANKYLMLMELAWALIIVGTLFINGIGFGDSIHTIVTKLGATKPMMLYVVYGFILVGFGFKAGVWPLGQLWLPDAHSIAPSPISALLSGVMLKTGIYGILRTFFWMVPVAEAGKTSGFNGFAWGVIVATIGVVTLFIGTVQSMKQSDSKRLLAYSSIGQIGYIVMASGCALLMVNSNNAFLGKLGLIAIVGALYHVLNHAIFKGLLFLTAGSVLYTTGTKDLNKLGGLLKVMPISAVIAGIASLSIAGVPPFSGFASKWTIISTSILGGSELVFLAIFGIVALFTSAITLSCYVKFFGMTFTSAGSEWNTDGHDVKEVNGIMLLPKVVLTLCCIAQGVIPYAYFSTIVGIFKGSAGSTLSESFANFNFAATVDSTWMGVGIKGISSAMSAAAVPAAVLLVFGVAYFVVVLLRKSGGSEERVAPTWLCGYQDLHNFNRYKDRNMFSALKNFFRWTGGNVK